MCVFYSVDSEIVKKSNIKLFCVLDVKKYVADKESGASTSLNSKIFMLDSNLATFVVYYVIDVQLIQQLI